MSATPTAPGRDPASCPVCHTPLPADAPHGLCPACLLRRISEPTEAEASAAGHDPGCPLRPQPPALEDVAAVFPQLEILRLIGQGGMGVVYQARQKSLDRPVALKLLAPGREHDARFAARFAQEARALAALNHPHIVTIHDFGQAGPFYFLLMEFIDGPNLRQLLRNRKLTPEEALAIVPPLCDALQFAHERGIVHRDIKPENLLLDQQGRVKIADFGIARMLGTESPTPAGSAPGAATQPAGTPGYMAPEQSDAHRTADNRADIYSLGIVLYEMLTGERPTTFPEPPSRKVQIDVRLDAIVLRALEADPERRYQTAGEFRTQIDTVVASPSAAAPRMEPPARPPRPTRYGQAYVTDATRLATLAGQFFLYRQHGPLALEERALVVTDRGTQVRIPLTNIRDISLGTHPRTVNPAGLALIRITWESESTRRELYLSPFDRRFQAPSDFNAHVEGWHRDLREAVTATTGNAPTLTPPEQLGIPPASRAILALLAAAILFTLLVPVAFLLRGPASPFLGAATMGILTFLSFFGILAVLAHRYHRAKGSDTRPRHPLTTAAVAVMALQIVIAAVVLAPRGREPGIVDRILDTVRSGTRQSTQVRVAWKPIEVRRNVLILDLDIDAPPPGLEATLNLQTPTLPPDAERLLDDAFVNTLEATLIRPTPQPGNRPWNILGPGQETWRVGFAFPTPDEARVARDCLNPTNELRFAVLPQPFDIPLFTLPTPSGLPGPGVRLTLSPPITVTHSNWVAVNQTRTQNEQSLKAHWTIDTSRPAWIRVRHGEGNLLQGNLMEAPPERRLSVELTQIAPDRVEMRLVVAGRQHLRYLPMTTLASVTDQITGSLANLVDEFNRTAAPGIKTLRNTPIELARIKNTPLVLEVVDLPDTTHLTGMPVDPPPVTPRIQPGNPGPVVVSRAPAISLALLAAIVLVPGALIFLVGAFLFDRWAARQKGEAWKFARIVVGIFIGLVALVVVALLLYFSTSVVGNLKSTPRPTFQASGPNG